ncbi:MAG: 50S ribosomal protein L19 [bacterium]
MKSAIQTTPIDMKERAGLGLRSGDTVRVWQKIVELKKTKGANKKEVLTKSARTQAFEGLILAVKHGTEAGSMFTVRKVASGVGTEKIFPLYSPMIDSIEILRRAEVRRAKLYFIRTKATREVKRAMRKSVQMAPSAKKGAEVAPLIEDEILDTAPAVEVDVATEAPQTEEVAA